MMNCATPAPNHRLSDEERSLYRITDDQPGHELVKTEEFLVPVGSSIIVRGLEFAPGSSTLTPVHKQIIQQIFNSIEEVTENTVNNTNRARAAEFKKMRFEIRGHPDSFVRNELNAALAEQRSHAVLDLLTYLGVPPTRLTATGPNKTFAKPSDENRKKLGKVEFIRTR
jgi:outer membrane protein OmpA-like peptidoglycan-associated protein